MAAPGQDPNPATPEAAPAPAAPAAITGPWAADAERYFEDPAARESFDRYMREVQQPHVTQLEQGPANLLYRDLTDESKVDVTVAAIVRSVYGDEVLQKFLADLEAEPPAEEAKPDPPVEEAKPTPAEEAKPTPEQEWLRSKMEEEEKAADEAEYDKFLDEVIAEPEFKLTPEDKELLHPFMADSETVGEAVQRYHGFVQQLATRHGISLEQARDDLKDAQTSTPEQPAEQTGPPPTIGSQGGTVPQHVEKKYETWDDLGVALQDYQREQVAKKAGHAPPTL
jgi:hypothetical protein